MSNLSKIHQEIARIKYADVRYPKTDEGIYWQYYFRLETYFQELVDDIYLQASEVVYPITTKPIEEYLSGYVFHFHAFDKTIMGKGGIEGFWDCDSSRPFDIHVLYNTNGASKKRQRFTQVHECLHVLQFFDQEFRAFLDDFITYETLPYEMVSKLAERVADRAAAMYLVPKEELLTQYARLNNVHALSEYFQVSCQSIVYRLKNSGVLVPT